MATMERKAVDFERREVVLRADFDLLDEDRCIRVSMRFIHGRDAPRPGDLVYLLDGRGRGCTGTVDRVDGHYARVCPDWSTFTGGPLPSGLLR
jgi:hypothetical protein